jgi:hypothetical protein
MADLVPTAGRVPTVRSVPTMAIVVPTMAIAVPTMAIVPVGLGPKTYLVLTVGRVPTSDTGPVVRLAQSCSTVPVC